MDGLIAFDVAEKKLKKNKLVKCITSNFGVKIIEPEANLDNIFVVSVLINNADLSKN